MKRILLMMCFVGILLLSSCSPLFWGCQPQPTAFEAELLPLEGSNPIIPKDFSGSGKWRYSHETNPLTGLKTVIVSLYDDSNEAFIVFRLLENRVSFHVGTKLFLADNNTVRYRFDDEKMITQAWELSESKTALFLHKPQGYVSIQQEGTYDIKLFLIKLMNSDRFTIGVTPYRKTETAYVFDVRGLRSAIYPYLDDFVWRDVKDFIDLLQSD